MQLNTHVDDRAVLQCQKVGTPLVCLVFVSLLSGVGFVDGDQKIANLNMSWGCITDWGRDRWAGIILSVQALWTWE